MGVETSGGDGIVIENPSEEIGDAAPRHVVGEASPDSVQEMARRLTEFFSGVSHQLVTFHF